MTATCPRCNRQLRVTWISPDWRHALLPWHQGADPPRACPGSETTVTPPPPGQDTLPLADG